MPVNVAQARVFLVVEAERFSNNVRRVTRFENLPVGVVGRFDGDEAERHLAVRPVARGTLSSLAGTGVVAEV